MKKIILALLLTNSILAQKDNYISFATGIDVRNVIVGSKPTNNKSAIDYQFQFSMVDRNVEVNIGYESFNRINFDKYSIGIGYHIPLYANLFNTTIKTTFVPSIEPSLIGRWGKWGGGLTYNQVSSHLSLGINFGFKWNLSDSFGVEYCFNTLPRTDLSTMYGEMATKNKCSISGIPLVGSNYFKLIYKINRF